MNNKKILFVSLATMGGCQRVTINYAKILHDAGYDCEFLLWVDSPNDKNVVHELLPSDIPYTFISCRLRNLPIDLYKFIRKRGGYDCVFSSWGVFSISLCIAKFLPFNRIKRLVIRDENMPDRHAPYFCRLFRWFGWKADALIAQTAEMKKSMQEHYGLKKNVVVIHNPLDKEWIEHCINQQSPHSVLEGEPVYIASGRISPQKDYVTMIKAFSSVVKERQSAHLYIMGDSGNDESYLNKVTATIAEHNLQKRVTLLGFQMNPYIYMKYATVLVLSSIYEGLPNVVLEALYLGKPVAVTTCIPYLENIIQDGVNGYKAAPLDHEGLADAMLKAARITDLPLRNDINQSDRTIVELFNRLNNG